MTDLLTVQQDWAPLHAPLSVWHWLILAVVIAVLFEGPMSRR